MFFTRIFSTLLQPVTCFYMFSIAVGSIVMFLGLYVLPHTFLIFIPRVLQVYYSSKNQSVTSFISSNIYSFISLIPTLYFLWILFTFSFFLKWMLISFIFNTSFEIYVFNFKGYKFPSMPFNLYHKHDNV